MTGTGVSLVNGGFRLCHAVGFSYALDSAKTQLSDK